MQFIPLLDNYTEDLAVFQSAIEDSSLRYALDEWEGGPQSKNYMLVDVDENERTHWMMYEDTSEGTPISPVFATADELCRWLVAESRQVFEPTSTVSYEKLMRICALAIREGEE